MPHRENNYEEWKEIRGRADSIASAIFLIAGGALSLSITVILGNKSSGVITPAVAEHATSAWYWLLAAIITFLVMKIAMVGQAFLLHFNGAFLNKHLTLLNSIGWVIGTTGFACFCWGLVQMVHAAALAVGT